MAENSRFLDEALQSALHVPTGPVKIRWNTGKPERSDEDQEARRLLADDDGPHSVLRRIAMLEGESDSQRQVIWLLVKRLGGTVTLTDEELLNLPAHSNLKLMRDFDGIHIAAAEEG